MIKLSRLLKEHSLAIGSVLVLIFLQSLANLYLPNLMSNIVDVGIAKGNIPYIWTVGLYMVLVTVGGALCSVLASYQASRVSTAFGRKLRSTIFRHVEGFALHEFDKLGTASLITRSTNDIMQVQQLVNMMLRMMVMAPMMAIGGIIMAVTTDAKLSIIIVVVVPVLSLGIYAIMSKSIGLFRIMQSKIDTLNRVLRENLTGVRVIRSFHRTDYELYRFDGANRDLTNTAVRVNQIMALLWPLMMLIINFATLAILWFGGVRINDLSMQVGNLMAFLQYVMQILFSIMMVSMVFFMFPRASASAARINEVLETEPEIKDSPVFEHQLTARRKSPSSEAHLGEGDQGPNDEGEKSDGVDGEIVGQVEFRDVTFSYAGAEAPAISGISFLAKPGQVTAIIGGTGAGKSSLVNLILRFHDVSSGSVLVDGIDVRDMPQADLRAKIGFVPQKAILFTGTVAENIRYGKEDATDEEVEHAAIVAQAMEFIADMPERFDSLITQGGTNVSGGQKQRLSIARALVRKPEVYIFDDSFSALDFKTDAKLRAALREEITHSTVLIVAQRVSTVMDADQILVLDEGRQVGLGTHRQLLSSCDVYREIVASQMSEEEIA